MTKRTRYKVPDRVDGHVLNPERGAWSVIVPKETTNYILNPSAETNLTGWTSPFGSALTRDPAYYRGFFCLRADGGFPLTNARYGAGIIPAGQYVYSAYVLGIQEEIGVLPRVAGVGVPPQYVFKLKIGSWTRISIPVNIPFSSTLDIDYIVFGLGPTISIDAQQLELGTVPTTYFDGDSGPDYYWTGTPHGSTSVREASAFDGGDIIRFDDLGFMIDGYSGAGMPTHDAVRTGYAILDGGRYDGTIIPERILSLKGTFQATDVQQLQRKKAAVIQAINRDINIVDAPIALQYQLYDCLTAKGKALRLSAAYVGGLEGDVTNDYNEPALIQFRSDDPFFYETDQQAITLATSQLLLANRIMQSDSNNKWSILGTGMNTALDQIYVVFRAQNGAVFAGGAFANAGGVAVTANFAYFLNGVWNSAGVVNGEVRAIIQSGNGDLYVGGNFVNAGGIVGATRIARYRPSTNTWFSLAGLIGADATVYALAFDNMGLLYIGGNFLTVNGVASSYLIKWNGTAYISMGVNTPNARVEALAVATNNIVYVGGFFSFVFATAANKIAAWNDATLTWAALGTGMTFSVVDLPIVRSIVIAPSGEIYAGGNFVQAGGTVVNHIALWTGSTWRALQTGVGVVGLAGPLLGVHKLAWYNSLLHVCGQYNSAGQLSYIFEGYARWNGSTWILADSNLSGSPTAPSVTAVYADVQGVILGFSTGGITSTSVNTAVTVNATANTYPIFRFTNNDTLVTRRLYQIVNETTGEAIYFDLPILSGESITIDLTPTVKSISSNVRGNLNSAPLNGSNLAQWHLAPKTATRNTNIINIFMGGLAENVTMFWYNRHWSVDGGGY